MSNTLNNEDISDLFGSRVFLYVMPIPKHLLKILTEYLASTDISLNFFIDMLDNQYRQNYQLWYK